MFGMLSWERGLWEVSALCMWGMGFERCNSEKMEQRFKDASCLIFLALMCLAVLSLKLPT